MRIKQLIRMGKTKKAYKDFGWQSSVNSLFEDMDVNGTIM
jgi:hypothetical protein